MNGSEARDSTAVFAGDLIETKPGFSATLNLEGSEILLAPEAVSKFNGDSLEMDHGSVSVGTSKSFKLEVKCITVVPVSSEWTQFEVSDVNGTVRVAAHKKDVTVELGPSAKPPTEGGSGGGVVHEGEEKSFDESQACGTAREPASPGHAVNPKWIAAGAAGAGLLIWILIHSTGGQSPITPSSP